MVALELGGQPGPAQQPAGHRQPERRPTARAARSRRCRVRGWRARRPAGPGSLAVMRRARVDVAARLAGEDELPSSRTSAPPWRASRSRPACGPRRRAVLASVSASSAVGARAVAWMTPVHAGVPRAGSIRWWAKPCSVRQRRVCRPLVATAPAVDGEAVRDLVVEWVRGCGRCAGWGRCRRCGCRRRRRRRRWRGRRAVRRRGRRPGPWRCRRGRCGRRAGSRIVRRDGSTAMSCQRRERDGAAGRRAGAAAMRVDQRRGRRAVARVRVPAALERRRGPSGRRVRR